LGVNGDLAVSASKGCLLNLLHRLDIVAVFI